MINKILTLVWSLIFSHLIFSCKMEEENLPREDTIQQEIVTKPVEFHGNSSGFKQNSLSHEVQKIKNNEDVFSNSIGKFKKEKKYKKKLIPGITPLSN